MGYVVSFSNHKGGTGKTTSTINIACALRDQKKKVLVIDLDPQGNLSYSLGVTDYKFNVIDWLTDLATDEQSIIPVQGIYIVPSSVSIATREEDVKSLWNFRYLMKEKAALLDFDYILIDCPPTIGAYTQIALTASDFVIIPILLEILSIQGLSQIMKFIKEIKITSNPGLEILGVLGVCVNESRKLTNEVLEYIDFTYKVDVFNNRVHNNVKAAEAPSFAKSVIDYAPESTSARDYKSVTEELLKKIENSTNLKRTTN
ncbi:MAG: ParA family protein [Bacteroidota bacterium]|nr:ParA family protein [Bacteroidota bacterium]